MKERLTNNLGLKLLSILLAFFVWLVVVNISNPTITGSKVVTVEVLNEDNLKRSQLTYSIVEKNSVTVRYQVRTLDEYKVKSSDFRAYINLDDLYEPTGAVPVKVEIVNNRELIESAEAKPDVLHVETENLQRKRFDLQIVTKGELEDGYALGTTILSKDYVYVNGPESMVGQINSVGVEINVEGVVSDMNGVSEPKFYDSNGNQLTPGDKVTIDTESVEYQTQILKVKNLTLDFETEGAVADGYRYTGIECDVQSVPVVGLKSALASLNSITIPKEVLNLQGATSDKAVEVDIALYLPPGTKLVGENSKVAITMKVEKLVTKTLTVGIENIPLTGSQDNYSYHLDNTTIDIVVEGLKEDLDSLKPEELNAFLDVGGMMPGEHDGKVGFTMEDGFRIISYESILVTVADKDETASSVEDTKPSASVDVTEETSQAESSVEE